MDEDGLIVDVLRFGDVVLLGVSGELTGEGRATVERAVAAAVESGAKVVKLGLAGVTGMDTSGLDVLLRARQALEGPQIHLQLVLPSKEVRRILEVTETEASFEVVDA
jgi:anti-anti-sigma factor